MLQNLINHVVFVVDASGSMHHLTDEVVKVFDSQVAYLARRSKELDQETRVSLYLFNTSVKCVIYDKDVLRLPSLKSLYNAGGGTALIDGAMVALDELALTPEIHGDHAFLVYVLTDGEENSSRKFGTSSLHARLSSIKDNWTVAALVPDSTAVYEAKRFGFSANNVQVWDASSKKGVSDAGTVIQTTTNTFMENRARGIRGTKSLFSLDSSALNARQVKKQLDELPASDYALLQVHKKSVIQPFVESWMKQPYIKGSAYYQLTKPEKVQNYKQICLQDKTTGKVFAGTNARELLGLPNHEVKVDPLTHSKYNIFVQSTSVNRNLVPGTQLIVLK